MKPPLLCSLMLVVTLVNLGSPACGEAAEPAQVAKPTLDLGLVVSDLGQAARFYTEAIGFTEFEGFTAPSDFARDAGLTDGKPLVIRVFALGKGPDATKLKLMSTGQGKPSDNRYLDSQLGFSYITIFVSDTNAALERLKQAGVQPVAKSPVPLPRDLAEGIYLTVVRDPDGNFVELVGPKLD